MRSSEPLRDSPGQWVGARVKGTFRSGATTHGIVTSVSESETHGLVIAILDFDSGHLNHLPIDSCVRFYGATAAYRRAMAAQRREA